MFTAETNLPLIETTILGKAVHICFSDHVDATKATEWVDIHVVPGEYILGDLKLSDNADRMPLGAIRLAALHRAQAVIDAETRRLSALLRGRSD